MKRARRIRRSRKGDGSPVTTTDRGTPEMQAIRARALGAAADLLPLSADNPIDVLTARKLLTTEQNEAARNYQRAHALVYGASQARAAALGMPQGREPSTRARLIAERFLVASNAIVMRFGNNTQGAFSRYVISECSDSTIAALRSGARFADLLPADRDRIRRVESALRLIASMPRIVVSDQDVAMAQASE